MEDEAIVRVRVHEPYLYVLRYPSYFVQYSLQTRSLVRQQTLATGIGGHLSSDFEGPRFVCVSDFTTLLDGSLLLCLTDGRVQRWDMEGPPVDLGIVKGKMLEGVGLRPGLACLTTGWYNLGLPYPESVWIVATVNGVPHEMKAARRPQSLVRLDDKRVAWVEPQAAVVFYDCVTRQTLGRVMGSVKGAPILCAITPERLALYGASSHTLETLDVDGPIDVQPVGPLSHIAREGPRSLLALSKSAPHPAPSESAPHHQLQRITIAEAATGGTQTMPLCPVTEWDPDGSDSDGALRSCGILACGQTGAVLWTSFDLLLWVPGAERLCEFVSKKRLRDETVSEPEAVGVSSSLSADTAALSTVQRGLSPKELALLLPLKKCQEAFEHIFGQEQAKEALLQWSRGICADIVRRRLDVGGPMTRLGHVVLAGAPGTGKTTFARLMANVIRQVRKLAGIKRPFLVKEVQREDLIGSFVGQTTERVEKHVLKGFGDGLLFIDEAYRLTEANRGGDNQDYGVEALETIMRIMNDEKREIVVVMAGYKDLMRRFLDANAGLKRRIETVIILESYTPHEIAQIFVSVTAKTNQAGFRLSEDVTVEEVARLLRQHTTEAYRSVRNGSVADRLFRLSKGELDRRLTQRLENGDGSDLGDSSRWTTITLADVREAAAQLTQSAVLD